MNLKVNCGCSSHSGAPAGEVHTDVSEARYISQFRVPDMDCPSEERLIRMALESITPPVVAKFDIPNRLVQIFHRGNLEEIEAAMASVNLGASLEHTQEIDRNTFDQAESVASAHETKDAKVLRQLLAINGVMFFLEMIVGWLAQSTGLIADALDMFADAAVYGLALYAVGRSQHLKLKAAHTAGWIQMFLALGALFEVGRRFLYGSEPISLLMITFGIVALLANVWCLLLITNNRDNGAHMQASWIFSANDVIANLGVIVAGGLVYVTESRFPDLVIGLIIGVIVLNGARKILQIRS